MAESSGFDLIRHKGVEEQYFWLWYETSNEAGRARGAAG